MSEATKELVCDQCGYDRATSARGLTMHKIRSHEPGGKWTTRPRKAEPVEAT